MNPPASPAVRDCLRRQPRRRTAQTLTGAALWVPRLGLSVLVHEQVGVDGWACTAIGADHEPAALPVGVLLLSTVELSRAPFAGAPAEGSRTAEEFCAAWQVQVIDRGVPLDLTTALVEAADPGDRTVDMTAPGLVRRSGCRVTSGLARRRQQLIDMGAARSVGDRVELTLPGPVWTW